MSKVAGGDDPPGDAPREDTGGERQPYHWAETRARRAYLAAQAGRQGQARRALALTTLVFLLVVGLGVGLAAPRYFAAQGVAAAFCAALHANDPAAAYALLTTDARGGLSETDFAGALRGLAATEGDVRSCVAGALSGYAYTPGQAVASDAVVITRAHATLRGRLGLALVGGEWRVASVATSLYGAPLAPVAVVARYCAALQAGDFAGAYALFSATLQGAQTQADYVTTQDERAALTGKVTSCAMAALTMADSQTAQALVSVTRATGPRLGGEMQLQPDGVSWYISDLDPNIEGVDVGPYQTGLRFCADASAGAYGAAYALLSGALQARTTLAALAAVLLPASSGGWRCGMPMRGSYVVAGGVASYTAPLMTASGAPTGRTLAFQFALIQGTWWISGY